MSAHEVNHAAVPSQPVATAPISVPFGDPAALGLAAFALTTFVLSAANAGWIPASVTGVVFGLALFYGGAVQVIAGVWEFANHNTFGAVAFCSYGGFWMSFWYLSTATKLPAADAGKGVGMYLIAWGIFTLYMTIAAFRTNLIVFLVFVCLTLTYFALAIGEFAGSSGMAILGGYLGVLTALFAWYASFATVTNFTFKRTLLPLVPLAR
ncbi:MAG TPA: acetate uptake transporter [Microbacteriaceae bacterium]|nr:acetate uptake transporter [Microbacteriaceae bacterium]